MREVFRGEFCGTVLRVESPSHIVITTSSLHLETITMRDACYYEAKEPARLPFENFRMYIIRKLGCSMRARYLGVSNDGMLRLYAPDISTEVRTNASLLYEAPARHHVEEARSLVVQIGGIHPVGPTWHPQAAEELQHLFRNKRVRVSPYEGPCYGKEQAATLTLELCALPGNIATIAVAMDLARWIRQEDATAHQRDVETLQAAGQNPRRGPSPGRSSGEEPGRVALRSHVSEIPRIGKNSRGSEESCSSDLPTQRPPEDLSLCIGALDLADLSTASEAGSADDIDDEEASNEEETSAPVGEKSAEKDTPINGPLGGERCASAASHRDDKEATREEEKGEACALPDEDARENRQTQNPRKYIEGEKKKRKPKKKAKPHPKKNAHGKRDKKKNERE